MKLNKDLRLWIIPGASQEEIVRFKFALEQTIKGKYPSELVSSIDTKVFKFKKGQFIEIIPSERPRSNKFLTKLKNLLKVNRNEQ